VFALACTRLQNVYDKQCDVSLIIKSIVLHAKQLTQLVIQEEAQVRPASTGCRTAHGLNVVR
jgi:hypothetical protein